MHELTNARSSPLDELTERERGVSRYITHGMSNADIVAHLVRNELR